MKKLILTCSLLIAGVCIAFSQAKTQAPAPAPAPASANAGGAEKMMAKMKSIITLTPDQEAKIKPMMETFAKAKAENKTKYATDPKAMKEANEKAKETYKSQIKTVLTPDQQEKMKAAKAAEKEDGDKDKE